MRTLQQSLFDYPLELLEAIAELRGVQLASRAHPQVVDQLAAALTDPPNISAAVGSCSPEARAALRQLVSTGGRMAAPAFGRACGKPRTFGPGRLSRDTPWRQPVNPCEELWYLGLIARAFVTSGSGTVEFIFVPSDVLHYLPLDAEARPEYDLAPTRQPAWARLASNTLLQDACTLLCFVQEGGARVDHRGLWQHRSLATLNKRLLCPSEVSAPSGCSSGDELSLLLRIAHQLHWLQEDRRSLRLEPTTVHDWLRSTLMQQVHILWSAWRDDTAWNDLDSVPGLRCEGTWRHDPRAARHRLLVHLRQCQPGVWYSVAALAAAIHESDPDFQRPDGDYDSWYVRHEASGRFLRGFEHWHDVEGALIAHVVTGPAHWLGATDVGGTDSEPTASAPDCPLGIVPASAVFRLTRSGAVLLGLTADAPLEENRRRLTVRPDFSVLAPFGTRVLDRFRLSRFAEWERSHPEYCYRITRQSLLRAHKQGISSKRILAFLQRASASDLPPNIIDTLSPGEN